MPRIAVYTIALNEEKHVKRWYESAKDADLLLIADTGSSDKTVKLARSLGIRVYDIEVKPWRFDIARNASLALIPEEYDICIQLDMDEVLPTDWRVKIEEAWASGNTWPIYRHVTSRYPDGSARHYQHYFKIHPRKGFIWKYPIHEILISQADVNFKRELIDLEVDHIKDHSKSRTSYLDLLELAVRENPNDWRMAHYLNREYWYAGEWNKVLQTAYTGLEISGGWDIERASTCIWASDAAIKLGLMKLGLEWSQRATKEAPSFYESWHWHAHVCHLLELWQECFHSSSKILILDRQDHHLVKPEVWEWWGWDLLALSAHKVGDHQRAVTFGSRALSFSPNDQRLKTNLQFYKSSLQSSTNYELKSSDGNLVHATTYPIPEFPMGGSEILRKQLFEVCNVRESTFNVITSRCDVSLIDSSRINILWQHLNSDQEAVRELANPEFLESLDAIVFISNWQYHSFRSRFQLPEEKCHIIENAILPSSLRERKPSEKIQIVYSSTPWRGLETLLDSFSLIQRDDCELSIFSSTGVYGKAFYDQNDKDYHHLYTRAEVMDNVRYRGYVPHEVLRNELFNADIFAYPSTWAETFCLSAVEAGAAGLQLVVSNLGALPEVLGQRAIYVPYTENKKLMAKKFARKLEISIERAKKEEIIGFRSEQHMYFNENFSWHQRKNDWNLLFSSLKEKK